MYYVSYFEEYPIFEAAEGGYYYSGLEVIRSKSFNNRKQAQRFYNKEVKSFYNKFDAVEDKISYRNFGGYYKLDDEKIIAQTQTNSYYIGENCGVILSASPIQNRGRQVYC